MEFFCQAATLPGVSIPAVDQVNPFVPIRHAGDKVNFEEFSVTFKVDEYLENYLSIWDWIVKLGFPESHEQYSELSGIDRWTGEGLTSDCTIVFIDSKGKPRMEAVFEEAFPVGITNIEVDSRREDTQFVTATSRFAYTKFNMTRLNK